MRAVLERLAIKQHEDFSFDHYFHIPRMMENAREDGNGLLISSASGTVDQVEFE